MKKGFTLIEILAVVTIIGLIFVIALPKIINSLNSKKSDIDNTTNNMIISAAKMYVNDHNTKFDKIEGSVYCLPLTTLTKEEYLDSKVKNVTDDKDITNIKSVKISYDNTFHYEIVNKKDCIVVNRTYQRLEYIEKDGNTQYINTGLIPQPDWTYEFDFERTGKFSYLCGSDSAWSLGSFNISIDLNSHGGVSGIGLRTLNFGKLYVSSNLIPEINERLIIKKTPNQFIIGTNVYNIEIGDTYAQYPLVIFTTNRNGTPQLDSIFIQQYRLYSFKITDGNGNLIQELLPALDKNGVVGMYDTIKRKFHYNQGTGEFIAGPIKSR